MAKTILLADDSVTIQKVVELTFMDEDYAVVAVSDGAAALARLPEVDPDLVIADVHMPGADGYEVCRRTKESHPAIPVLLLVGTFEQFDEQQATAAGADGHLKKPFDSQELLNQVEKLVASGAGTAAVPAAEALVAEAPAAAALVAEAPAAEALDAEEIALEAPTAEIPLAAFTSPPSFDEPSPPSFDEPSPPSFDEPSPPAFDAPSPPAGDLEPPRLLDESGLEPDDTRPTAARASDDVGDVFELAEEGDAEEPEAEPGPVPAAAATAPIDLEPEPLLAAEAPAGVEAPVLAEAAPAPAMAPAAPAAAAQTAANGALSEGDVARIARKVAEMVGDKMLREVAWEVIPDLAEVIIKERIRELESQVE